jgi:outer membrane biosynthesis protein TonB
MLRIIAIMALLASGTTVSFGQSGVGTQSPVQPPRQSKIRVSGGVMAGLVEHRVLPEYPEQAMKKGIQGDVIFKIVVDDSGMIVLSVPVEGDPLLVAASLDALRDYRFRPCSMDLRSHSSKAK